MIRKAEEKDLDQVADIYDDILEGESRGTTHIGWVKGVYPTRETAIEALKQGDLFVEEENGIVRAAARINQEQMPAYAEVDWEYPASRQEVMVLHTLVVSPSCQGMGIGRHFVDFYEQYALAQGCPFLRIDTNAKNTHARKLYQKLGYSERGIIPCVFNGIEGVQLVCLEKKIGGNRSGI